MAGLASPSVTDHLYQSARCVPAYPFPIQMYANEPGTVGEDGTGASISTNNVGGRTKFLAPGFRHINSLFGLRAVYHRKKSLSVAFSFPVSQPFVLQIN